MINCEQLPLDWKGSSSRLPHKRELTLVHDTSFVEPVTSWISQFWKQKCE